MKYIIGVKRYHEAPPNWMDEISAKLGIKEESRGSRYLFIESSEYTIQHLKNERPYLAIEEVIERKPS